MLCAPQVAAERSSSIADLQDRLLLHSVKNVVQRVQWFDRQGHTPQRKLQCLRFDRTHLSIDMASSGVGIALESHLTASREIAEGRIRPLHDALPVWQQSLWLVCPHSHLNRRKVRRFVEWLKGTLQDLPVCDRPVRPQRAGTIAMAAQAAP